MITSTFIQTLVHHSGKELQFRLPDETRISGDLHITEIQNHHINSVDCGGSSHVYDETVVQLWINEHSKNVAEWTTVKALKIFELVGEKQDYIDTAELYIEFGDSAHDTIRYSIGHIHDSSSVLIVELTVKPTACKPRSLESNKAKACC